MKKVSFPLRFGLLAGVAASLVLQPLTPSRADDHGGGTGQNGGGDDGGGQLGSEDHGKTEFLGTVQALPATANLTGSWTVDGHVVNVDAATLIRTGHGAPTVGGKVEIEGSVQADGSVLANSIKTEDAAMEREDNVFFGVIQTLPATGTTGTWQVGGLTVLVSNTTSIETEGGDAVIGTLVRVEGVQQPDASIVASEIEIQTADAAAQQAAHRVKLKGAIQQLPAAFGINGNWVVDGVVVTVSDDSVHVAGGRKAKVGRHVVIKGTQQVNGSILAGKVKVPRKGKPGHP